MRGSYLKGNRLKNKSTQEKSQMLKFKHSAFEDNNLTFNIQRVDTKKKMQTFID